MRVLGEDHAEMGTLVGVYKGTLLKKVTMPSPVKRWQRSTRPATSPTRVGASPSPARGHVSRPSYTFKGTGTRGCQWPPPLSSPMLPRSPAPPDTRPHGPPFAPEGDATWRPTRSVEARLNR